MLKSKDTFALVFLISISALVSFFANRLLFGGQDSLTTQVEVVDSVSSEFDYMDKPYFSADKINPTKDITVSENDNKVPLGTE